MGFAKTGKYRVPGLSAQDEAAGYYFPDAVVDAFAREARNAGKPAPEAVAQPVFTLEESRALVQAAIGDFDPALGQRAKAIFDAGFNKAAADSRAPGFHADWDRIEESAGRWKIEQVPPGQSRMMRSTPARAEASEYGPANPNDHSVIDYQFDGTINGVVYMAHETGHSIADDLQRGKGFQFRDLPQHMNETQAYFVQHMLYDYVRRHPELEEKHPGIMKAAERAFAKEMQGNIDLLPGGAREDVTRLHSRPMGILTALALHNRAREQGTQNRIATALLGGNGPKPIGDVLAAAGIEYKADLQKLAQTTIQRATADWNAHVSRSPVTAAKPV